jgi:tol-pal system protein YbgF
MNKFQVLASLALAVTVALPSSTSFAQAKKAPVRSVEQRLRIIEQQLSSQALIAMMQDVRALRRESAALRGENQVLTNKLEKMAQTVRELSSDMERRLQRIATASPASAQPQQSGTETSTATVSSNTAAGQPAAASSVSSGDAQEDYQGAVDQLMAGKYGSAVRAFEGFLKTHGDTEYSGNAMYWLAETYDQQERSEDALSAYGRLIENYPDHQKVPEASLKSAFILDDQGKRREAVQALQSVLRDYPKSSVEPLARQRLADIQKR